MRDLDTVVGDHEGGGFYWQIACPQVCIILNGCCRALELIHGSGSHQLIYQTWGIKLVNPES